MATPPSKSFWRELLDTLKLIGTTILNLDHIFAETGGNAAKWLLTHLTEQAIKQVPKIVASATHDLTPAVNALVKLFESVGPPLFNGLRPPLKSFVSSSFHEKVDALHKLGASTPENAEANAAAALADAFGFGLASGATTAAFEAVIPEKLNAFNGVGPMLAELAGFKEVEKTVIEPLYENAFGKSLEYKYRALFKPELPDEADAVNWHSKRVLTDTQLRKLFEFSGLKPEYEAAFIYSAYRAVSPFVLGRLFDDQEFQEREVTDLLKFAGLRDADIAVLVPAFRWNTTRNIRSKYIDALLVAAEKGTMDLATVDSHLDTMAWSKQAKDYLHSTVAIKRLETLAELYRKSVTTLYETNQLTDNQYIPALEAIGIDRADAEAHYAVDSAKRHGKVLAQEEREAEKLAEQVLRERLGTAKTEFLQGGLSVAAAILSLLTLGLPQSLAVFTANHWEAEREARRQHVYGRVLPHDQAQLLREQVAALKEQVFKKLVSIKAAHQTLSGFDIPADVIEALLAEWAAHAYKQVLAP